MDLEVLTRICCSFDFSVPPHCSIVNMSTSDPTPTKKRKVKPLPMGLSQLTEANFKEKIRARHEIDPKEDEEAKVAFEVILEGEESVDLTKLTLDQLRQLCSKVGCSYVNVCNKFQCRKKLWILAEYQLRREQDRKTIPQTSNATISNIVHSNTRKGEKPASAYSHPHISLTESIRAGVSKRCDFPLVASKSALLIIDVQRYCCELRPGVPDHYKNIGLPRMLKNIQDLLCAFRKKRDAITTDCDPGMSDETSTPQQNQHFPEVIFVVIQSMTNDRRDMSIDYKLSGPYFADIPKVASTDEEIFLPGALTPNRTHGRGDIVVPKTACSAFATTNLDRLLRNLFVEQLVVCGQLTDQCVESAVRDAADLGYLVTVAKDACAAHSHAEHDKGLFGMKGFCRILSTTDILREIERA